MPTHSSDEVSADAKVSASSLASPLLTSQRRTLPASPPEILTLDLDSNLSRALCTTFENVVPPSPWVQDLFDDKAADDFVDHGGPLLYGMEDHSGVVKRTESVRTEHGELHHAPSVRMVYRGHSEPHRGPSDLYRVQSEQQRSQLGSLALPPILGTPIDGHSVNSISGVIGGGEKLGRMGVVAVLFFSVSGGPWGSEPMFQGGPLYGIVTILVIAVVWCIPQIQMVAELSCMWPVNGGYSIWVTEAIGPFAGCMESYFSWVSGVVDNTVYPVLIFDALKHFLERPDGTNIVPETFWGQYLCKLLIIVLLCVPNFYSTKGAGSVLKAIGILQLIPFIPFFIVGLPKMDWRVLTQKTEEFDWLTFANVAFWNLSGWDAVSTMAGEIRDTGKNLYPASVIGLILVVLQYLIILSVAAGTSSTIVPWEDWKDGSLPHIVKAVCGSSIGFGLMFSSCLGNAGQFIAELLEDSYQLQGLAEADIIPRWTGLDYVHPKYNTPWVALLPSCCFICLSAAFDFKQLLVIDNAFTIIASLLQMVSFYVLRRSHKDTPRPYKMACVVYYILMPLSAVFAFLILGSALSDAFRVKHGDRSGLYVVCTCTVIGVCGSIMLKRRYGRQHPDSTGSLHHDSAFPVPVRHSSRLRESSSTNNGNNWMVDDRSPKWVQEQREANQTRQVPNSMAMPLV